MSGRDSRAGDERGLGVPADTLAPVVLAAGIVLGAAGIVTHPFVTVVGVMLAAPALVAWTAEAWREVESGD